MNFPIQLIGCVDPSMSIFKPSEKTIKEAQQRRENLNNKLAHINKKPIKHFFDKKYPHE